MPRDNASKNFFGLRAGMTIAEIVVYTALLSVSLLFIAAVLFQIQKTYQEARTEHQVISNGRSALETMTQTIASAQALYAPTSRFGANNGQITLITTIGALTEHSTAYADFWLDNGRIWTRREGSATTSLTSPEVRVNQLRFDQVAQGLNREAVKITLQMVGTKGQNIIASTTLYTTTALRGTY